MATATAKNTLVFYTKNSNLLLVRVPEITEPTSTGGTRVTQRGLSYQFKTGRLEVSPGQDPLRTGEQEVDDNGDPRWDEYGYPILEVEDVVSWLRRHINFNNFFTEEGNEPDLQRPTWDEVLDELIDAVNDGNPDRVEELLASEIGTDEEPGHRRDSVIKASEKALEKIAERAGVLPEG